MMLKSKRYPYLNCIDSQALLAQCEKKGQKDSLSALTQYLHNRKYMSAAGRKEAFSLYIGGSPGQKERKRIRLGR